MNTKANPPGWGCVPVQIAYYGPDQTGNLRHYSSNPHANNNPPMTHLSGALLGVDIVPAGADQPHGGHLYLAIDLQGLIPQHINQLRLRIGTGLHARNWPVRTALYGLCNGGFQLGSEVILLTRSGSSTYFINVLSRLGRPVIPPCGYWSLADAIGYTPWDILSAVNDLRRRLNQPVLGPEVFGDLLSSSSAAETV